MIIEVKLFPESQEVIDDKNWFPVFDSSKLITVFGDSAYARVMDKDEYILVEKTTADEFNPKPDDCMITYRDPGDENEKRKYNRRKIVEDVEGGKRIAHRRSQ